MREFVLAGLIALLLAVGSYVWRQGLNQWADGTNSQQPFTQATVASVDATTHDVSQHDHYDFGYVLPNSDLFHEFVVENNSAGPWVIDSVKTSCGCTTAKPSKEIVNPTEDLMIPVHFNPRATPQRNTQRVTIVFRSGNPDRVLTVSAVVRAPLTVSPASSRTSLNVGQRKTGSFTVENFSEFDWTEVAIVKKSHGQESNWLAISGREAPPVLALDANVPRQRWVASLFFNTDHLVPGKYREIIDISARGSGDSKLQAQSTVELEVRPEVSVIPPNVFIPSSGNAKVIRKSVLFRFADKLTAPPAANISLTHDLPFAVHLECPEPRDGMANAVLEIGPLAGEKGTVRGKIVIAFGKPVNKEVVVPVVVIDKKNEIVP